MLEAAAEERFERAAHLRDAIRTIETLRDRQQKMESPSLGDRDAFGLKVGPAGAVVQVFQMRRGRVVDRIELVTDPDPLDAARAPPPTLHETDVFLGDTDAAAARSSMPTASRRRRCTCPVDLADDDRDAIVGWLEAEGRPSRPAARAAARRQARAARSGVAQRRHGLSVALQCRDGRLVRRARDAARRAGPARAAAPDRVLRYLDAAGPRDGRVDGRVRRGSDETRGVPEVQDPGSLSRKDAETQRGQDAGLILDDFASMHEVVLRRYQRVLEQGGPFPDLILIDGGKGQLTAAYSALRDVGLGAADCRRHRQAGGTAVHARSRRGHRAAGRQIPPCTSADPARSQRSASIRRDVFTGRPGRSRDLRSELDDIPGIGPRRRKLLLTTFGSVGGVRRASREELERVVGARAADRAVESPRGRGG